MAYRDTTVDRLETVPGVRKGTLYDDAHGVVDKGVSELLLNQPGDDSFVATRSFSQGNGASFQFTKSSVSVLLPIVADSPQQGTRVAAPRCGRVSRAGRRAAQPTRRSAVSRWGSVGADGMASTMVAGARFVLGQVDNHDAAAGSRRQDRTAAPCRTNRLPVAVPLRSGQPARSRTQPGRNRVHLARSDRWFEVFTVSSVRLIERRRIELASTGRGVFR